MKKIISLFISLTSAFFLYSAESIKLPNPIEAIENYRVPKIQEEATASVVSEEKKNEEGSLPSFEKDLLPQEVFIQELNEKKGDLEIVPTIQRDNQNESAKVEEVVILSENKAVENQESVSTECVKENEVEVEKTLIREEVTESKSAPQGGCDEALPSPFAPSDDDEEEKSEEPTESNIPICPSSTTESLGESSVPPSSEVIQAPLPEKEACEESNTSEEQTKDSIDQEETSTAPEKEPVEKARVEEKASAQLEETPPQSESNNETQETSSEQDRIITSEPEKQPEEKQPEEKKLPEPQPTPSVPKIEVTSQPVIPYQGPTSSFETQIYSNVPSYPTQTYVYPSSPVYYSEPSPCEPIYQEMPCYYPCCSLLEKSWTLEFRLGYFRPDSPRMRDTFDGGLDYEFEVTKSLCFDCMKLWANLNYYTKEGRESFLEDSTRVKLTNLSAGLKYFYNVWDCVDLYAGAGIDWAFARFNDHSPLVIPHTTKNNVGFVAKAGAIYNFCECFFIDLFFDYYAQENLDFGSNPNLARRSIDISGFRTGAGIGVAF